MINYKTARDRRHAPQRKPELDWRHRLRAAICSLLLGFVGAVPQLHALALGIGEPAALSRLFQPLRVEVPLELDGLPPEDVRLSLALDAISADGGSRPLANLSLQREIVVDPSGRALLRVASADLVREPALRLHVDLRASGIHIWRDLTLLFDPATQPASPRIPTVAAKPVGGDARDDAAALLHEAERVAEYGKPAKKPAAAQPRAVAPSGRGDLAGPARAPAGLALASRLAQPQAKPVAAPQFTARPAAKLVVTEGLTAASRQLLRLMPARPAAAPVPVPAPKPAVTPAPTPAVTAPPSPIATPTQTVAAAEAGAAPAQAPTEAAVVSLPAPPAAVAEPSAPPEAVTVPASRAATDEGVSGGQPLGLLLGLLVAGVLTFGWLFRTVRATDASRRLPEPPLPDNSLALRPKTTASIEPRITPLELGRNAPQTLPASRPAATRGPSPPQVEPAPRPPEAIEPAAKPLPKGLENWSPDDFDLLTPIDDKRPGRR